MRISRTHQAIIALIIANIIWGAASPVFKWSMRDVGPFTLAFLRFFIAALYLLPFTIHKLHIQRKDWTKFFTMAIVGVTFPITLLLLGLQIGSSIDSSIIGSAGPIFLIIGAIFILNERPKAKVIKGTLLSLVGILLIVIRPLFESHTQGSLLGNAFFIMETFVQVFYTIIIKEIVHKYDVITIVFYAFAIGSLGLSPMFIGEVEAHGFLSGITTQGLIGIFYGVFLSSLVGHLFYVFAIKHLSTTSEVGVFLYLDPLATIIVAVPLLGEVVTPSFIIGSILVFLGIFIAENRVHYHPFHLFRKSEAEVLPVST